MKLYFDASVIVRLLNGDETVASLARDETPLVSSFAVGEVGSVLSRLVRTNEIDPSSADAWLANFDEWCEEAALIVDTEAADIRAAARLVRQYSLKMKLPDTVHLILARRLEALLVTGDRRLVMAADLAHIPAKLV